MLSVRAGRALIANEQRATRSLQVRDQLVAVLGAMTDAETGQRGYVITGADGYLDPYHAARRRIDRLVAQVDSLTADDPIQSLRARILDQAVQMKLAELENVIALRRSGGFAAARAEMLTGRGKIAMEELRTVTGLMVATQNDILRGRSERLRRSARGTIALLIAGGVIELAALLLFYSVAQRGLAERRRAMQERGRLLDLEHAARTEAEAAGRAKDDFLAIASHELRTPVTALRLQVQIVERSLAAAAARAREAGEPRQAQELSRVLEQVRELGIDSRRIGALVGSLLDVTRIATGQFELHPEDCDLREVVDAAVDALHGALGAAPVVHVDLPDPLVGWWDRLRLEQVVTNLLSNAVRYGGATPITVRGRALDRSVELVVEDRGPGIAPELLPRLFDRFVRGSDREQGLGLGLYITRRIVEAHGGTITAEGASGQGARFAVRLPRA